MSAANEATRMMAEQTMLTPDAWTAFESRLRTYVRHRVAPMSVDDVVGDVLLRLVRHQDELGAADNPLAWMFRVASNTIADHYRRRASEQRALAQIDIESDQETRGDDGTGGSPSDDIAQCMVPLIEGLPERYRQALLLTEIEGLTQAAAASRLGISESGMKSRIQRGRAKLKSALLRCCSVQVDRRGGIVDYQRRADGCGGACDAD